MTPHVALLRAVNVGGAGKLSMADLRAVGETVGFAGAETILQSGSLVFSADDDPAQLERRLEAALRARLRLATEVIVRSLAQWRHLMSGNPFPALAEQDPARLNAAVLKGQARGDGVVTLRAAIRGREQVSLAEGVAYIHYPDGIGRSKLTHALIERHLGTSATGRNWSTVRKIAAALDARS